MEYHEKIASDINLDNIKYVNLYSDKYCITQLLEDLEWLYKTVSFSKSFSDYLVYINKSKNMRSINCPIDAITIDDADLDITEKTPHFKYKESVKCKYRNIVYALKHLYKNALTLPDAERVIHTIRFDFNLETDIFL